MTRGRWFGVATRSGAVFLGVMKRLFNLYHPFLEPLWRRVLICMLSFVWAGIEFWNGTTGWGAMFVIAGAWCFYQFFFDWGPHQD